VPIFASDRGCTTSHQFAIEAARYGGGQTAAKQLRKANLLASGIGLPVAAIADDMNGLRIGTPEIARWGMTPAHMGALGALIAGALSGRESPDGLAAEVTEFRRRFKTLHYVR
jgi:glycine hydroxymethyltransferase